MVLFLTCLLVFSFVRKQVGIPSPNCTMALGYEEAQAPEEGGSETSFPNKQEGPVCRGSDEETSDGSEQG